MPQYQVFAQLEPLKHERHKGVIEFLPNVVHIRTIEAKNSEAAFNIAKTIVPHPMVARKEDV